MGSNDELRATAISSLKKKHAFWNYLWIWLAVSTAVVIIWWFSTPGGYFWPVWPILGMAVAVPILGYAAFKKPGPSEKKIEQEMARLKKADPS